MINSLSGDQGFDNFLRGCLPEEPSLERILKKFKSFHERLLGNNDRLGLVSDNDLERIWTRHIQDSLMPLKLFPESLQTKLADVGSGAGFPGLMMAIARPDLAVHLIESNKKRTGFLEETIQDLELTNCKVVQSRAEKFGQNKEFREKFKCVLSRATAKAASILELTLPLVEIGGKSLYWVSGSEWDDSDSIKKISERFGGKGHISSSYTLPQDRLDVSRKIVVVEKNQKTNLKYPRRDGVPQNKPLN